VATLGRFYKEIIMAVTLNASLSTGLVQTADTSGNLNLQSGGTTIVAITSSGAAITGAVTGLTDLTTTGNTILGNASTDTLNVGNGGLIKDASGNVGVGTASPSVKFHVLGLPTATGSARYGSIFDENQAASSGRGGGIAFAQQGSILGGIYSSETGASAATAEMIFSTVSSSTVGERMKIDGSALTLSALRIVIKGASGVPAPINDGDGNVGTSAQYGLTLIGKGSSYDICFFNKVGNIAGYVATGATTITTSSDERLKENFIPITDAVKTIAKLRKLTGNYKSNPTKNVAFFIAQDMKEAFPQAFVDANPDEFGVDYNWTIPLVAAGIDELSAQIQEQQALIINLTSRLEALEAK
jgi:hypothetical protein